MEHSGQKAGRDSAGEKNLFFSTFVMRWIYGSFRDCLKVAMCHHSYKYIFLEPRCVARLVKLYHNACYTQ